MRGELQLTHVRKNIRKLKQTEDLDEEVKYYFEGLVTGVINNIKEIDEVINNKAIDWNINRMAYVDRNILRIAVFEMRNDIPVGVAINEAVEIAKEYADQKSAGFINGILARVE